jgi:hypothetical protein
MFSNLSRRDFVAGTVKAGALAAVTDLAFLDNLPNLSADDVKLSRERVQLSPDIEPLVRLVEDTPRAKLIDLAAEHVRNGMTYQQLLSAVLLAGVRSIQPRPVGFEFHCVLVMISAHLAALASEDKDRWLPLFWALENFKRSQEVKAKKPFWVMRPVDEGKLPSAAQAKQRFIEAMDNWDEEAADRAIAMLVRTAGAAEVSELFWRYGARDFRDIGHKAIYAANAWRTLQTIGWRHAEPVLRSLANASLDHEEGNPARRDAEADRPGRENLNRIREIRAHWQYGKPSTKATTELLQTLRAANSGEASQAVVKLLNDEVDPASVWDGLFLGAGELLMRQPGIVGLHCVTSTNALHYAFQASGNDETRRFVMLQAAAFLTMFRKRMEGSLRDDVTIDTLELADGKDGGAQAVEAIFDTVSRDRLLAARKTLACLVNGTVQPEELMRAARRLIFCKGNDSHDYKFSSAALEDCYHTSPRWQARYLATSMFNLKGTGDRDNDLIKHVRATLA